MRTRTNFLILISALLLSSCNTNNEKPFVRTLFEEDFVSGKTFTTFADLPPSPISETDLSQYKDLGFNTCLLTEDRVPLIDTEGHLSDSYKQAIRNIGNANMKCWIRNMYNDPDYFECDTEAASKQRSNYGAPYSLKERHLTTEFQEFDDIISGFYQGDEIYQYTETPVEHYEIPEDAPYRYSAMDQYQKLVDWQNEYYPNKAFHVNHVPSSSINHWPIGNTYESFIKYYVNEVMDKFVGDGMKTICLDNYPYRSVLREAISPTYLTDLLTCAKIAKEYNETHDKKSTFGFCVQLHSYTSTQSLGNLTGPMSPEEITYNLYSGLSMGARLIEYFCYRSISTVTGIVNNDGSVNERYGFTKEANRRVLPLQDVLSNFEWQNFYPVRADISNEIENQEAFDNIDSMIDKNNLGCLDIDQVSSRLDASIGYFKNNNQDAYFIVNQSAPIKNQINTINISFKDCNQALLYHEDSVQFIKLINGAYRLNLKPGDAYFLIPA